MTSQSDSASLEWWMQTYDPCTGYSKWFGFATSARLVRAARRAYDGGCELLFCGRDDGTIGSVVEG